MLRHVLRSLVASVALGALLVVSGAPGATVRPSLRVAEFAPATVVGRGFIPGESVRVTVMTGSTSALRVVRATNRGGFVARFPRVALNGCLVWSVTAVGARHDRATLKGIPQQPCPPPTD
jgi:hypothetical protein